MPRIAIIHPEGNIANNPNLFGIVEILCEQGYEVDYYCRRQPHFDQQLAITGVHVYATDIIDVEELAVILPHSAKLDSGIKAEVRSAFSGYGLLIGIDRGIIEAAWLARLCSIPYGLISYEIYFGQETGLEFKQPEQEACQDISFAVCQDRVRSLHLARENCIPLAKIIDIPVAGRAVVERERSYVLHDLLGIDRSCKIALYIGETTSKWAGFGELLESTRDWDESWALVLHHRYGQYSQETRRLLKNSTKAYCSPFPQLKHCELPNLLNAADLGIAFYLPQMESTIFQDRNNLLHIGMASGKIATYLQHGLPIIVNEIGLMSEYVRQLGLGTVVSDILNTGEALQKIDHDVLAGCSTRAKTFFREYLDLNKTVAPLLDIIGKLVSDRFNAGMNYTSVRNYCVPSAVPRISIVTPSYNQAEYLEECIESILNQNYPNLEYIIMDGGSTDGSVEIIKKYEKHLTYWQSKPDGGQYQAINEGFLRSTGEIMCWLNSDDKLHPGALHQVELAFRAMPQTEWITGRPTAWDDQGRLKIVFDHVPSWSLERLLYHGKDDYYIQQESTFWRRSLWDRAGGGLDTNWQLAADFELWCRFFNYSRLTGVDALFGGFRYHSGQKTGIMMDRYEQEVLQIIERERTVLRNTRERSQSPNIVGMGEIVSAITPQVTPDNFSCFSFSRRFHFNWFEAYAAKLFGSRIDPDYCDLKMYQDLLCYAFILDNFPKGARLLEVGGGDSRVLKALKHDYECWNVDKLEGLGNGLTEVKPDGYRMVQAYLVDFSKELPDRYFDLVFSISALEHVEEVEQNFICICNDMDRVMKPGAYSLHCFDVVAKPDSVWTNHLLPFLYQRYETRNRFIPFDQMMQDPYLYCMTEAAYERGWRNITKVPYKEFGRPLSCNILWQKPPDQPDSINSHSQSRLEITVATSIAPQNIDIQQKAITSWNNHGFNVISVNTASEIALLDAHFKSVRFVEATRDASDRFQKPLIYLDDIFTALQSCGSHICGIINADIHLMPNEYLADFIRTLATDSFVFGSRCDVDSLNNDPEDLFLKGRDYFFFDRSLIAGFTGTSFCLGAPWWDIWLPFAVMGTGVKPKQIQEKIAKHVRHEIRWDQDACWNECGKLFIQYMQRTNLPINKDERYLQLKSAFIQQGNGLPFAVFVTDYLMSLTDWVSLDTWAASDSSKATYCEPVENNICVTAIVSAYNSEHFMRGCLKDLTTQTLFTTGKLEIIVIDSASHQNEGEMVRHFQAHHPNIHYIRTESRETIYQAWNRGIKAARGKYITNANTDDRHRPDALEVMAETLDANPDIALVYGDCLVTNFPNQTFDQAIRCGYHIRPDYSPEIMLSGCHMGPQPMWRKNIHDEIGYFSEELRSAGDYEFWCRTALKYMMMHIPQFLGLYFENPRGFANSDTGLSARESLRIQIQYGEFLPAPLGDYTNNFQYWENRADNEFVHIIIVAGGDMPHFRGTLESLLLCTEFPHIITIVNTGCSQETKGFLASAIAAGWVTNHLALDKKTPFHDAVEAALRLVPQARWRFVIGNRLVFHLPGWLTLLLREAEQFPAAMKLTNRLWSRDRAVRSMAGLLPASAMVDDPETCIWFERSADGSVP